MTQSLKKKIQTRQTFPTTYADQQIIGNINMTGIWKFMPLIPFISHHHLYTYILYC